MDDRRWHECGTTIVEVNAFRAAGSLRTRAFYIEIHDVLVVLN
jgi:hypothetical protein